MPGWVTSGEWAEEKGGALQRLFFIFFLIIFF